MKEKESRIKPEKKADIGKKRKPKGRRRKSGETGAKQSGKRRSLKGKRQKEAKRRLKSPGATSRRSMERAELLRFFRILALFLLFIGSGVFLLHRWVSDRREKEAAEQLAKEKTASMAEPVPLENTSGGSRMLPEYISLYEKNDDLIGWLSIEDTVIDYPVMQTMEDEQYYLYRGFDQKENKNGSLFLDTDSRAGDGTAGEDYQDGTRPSTNLIIHGHTMQSGQMFGGLKKYADEEYGKEHGTICFDSLYEHREYSLISVFYSQVYYQNQDVFKYYKFFEASTQEEFDDWYRNIKKLSLYDTGVEAEFGDEFITLSCCSYHVENGMFVVVGKRIK